jgi:hypothetical protein
MIGTEVDIRNADLRMKPRLSVALVTALFAVGIGAPAPSGAGPCRHNSTQNCFTLPATVDFSSVPEISNEIVGKQPQPRPRQQPVIDPAPAANPYSGPMIGVDGRVHAPTVGYYWSIN